MYMQHIQGFDCCIVITCYMYINTGFNATLSAVPGSTAPTLHSSTATRHVSVSPGASSSVYVVAHTQFHCWYNDHALSIKLLMFIVLKNVKTFK
jgi:hypothetical protein